MGFHGTVPYFTKLHESYQVNLHSRHEWENNPMNGFVTIMVIVEGLGGGLLPSHTKPNWLVTNRRYSGNKYNITKQTWYLYWTQ